MRYTVRRRYTFCPNCGNPVAQAQAQAEASTAQASAPVNPAPQFDGSTQYYTPQPVLGLKWANFLGYFALWLGALVNLGSGISLITGLIYNGDASFIYDYFPGLQVLNILYGICLLAIVALGVITALAIIKRKKQAGTLVCLMYGVQAALSLIYIIGGTIILGTFAGDATTSVQIIVSIVMIFVNRVYFNNRRDVFVN